MKRDDYIGGSISARIYEKNLLSKNDLERLNDYDKIEDVLNALNDSSYRESIKDLQRPSDYEKILNDELKNTYKLIEEIPNSKDILQYFREKYNFHNLKVMAKEVLQDENYSNLYSEIANIDLAYIKENILKDKKNEDALVKETSIDFLAKEENVSYDELYLSYIREALGKFRETKDPRDLDIILDKNYYEKLLADSKNIGLEGLIKFTKEKIDLTNIKILLRIKAQNQELDRLDEALIDGGNIEISTLKELFILDLNQIILKLQNYDIGKYLKDLLSKDKSLDQSMLDLEKAIDDHQMQYSKKAKDLTYGPEVLINYIISKETEIKNLRIILVSKVNSLSKEFTLERLRETYA